MSSRKAAVSRLGVAVTFAAIIAGGAWLVRSDLTLHAQPTSELRVPATLVKPAVDLSDAFVKIADATVPAVVAIESRLPAGASDDRDSQDVPDEFRRFFQMPDSGKPEPEFAGGTGFIVRPDGYILTNAHVVAGADEVTVTLHDRRAMPARVIGSDPTTDVAVIKVEATNLPVLPFGSSDAVKVGEWVIAIGNPGFGAGSQLDYTVTAGIVSALGRPLQLLGRDQKQNGRFDRAAVSAIENFLQTDAVINPGNSGGPMIDLRGQVIGINSAIASSSGYYQGYGFAVPIDLARRTMQDLIQYGEVRRPVLGVEIQTVAPEDAEYYRLPEVSGVLVENVGKDSPAGRAGIMSGDVIVAVDAQPVGTVGQLQQRVAEHNPGDKVAVRYFRDGAAHDVQVTLGESTIAGTVKATAAPAAAAPGSLLGMEVQDMDVTAAKKVGFDRAENAVISSVDPFGAAGRRGLRPGLRVTAIDGKPIARAADVKVRLAAAKPGGIVSLQVEDAAGAHRIVNVRVPR